MPFAEFAATLAISLGLNGAIVAAAWLAGRALFPAASRSVVFLAAGTLGAAAVAYPLLALGAVGAISLWALAAVAAAALAGALWLHRRAAPRSKPPGETAEPTSWALAAVYACGAAYALDRALTLPPVSWDSLYYHLPMVVEWTRTGSLGPLYHPTGVYHSYFPGTGELYSLWALLPWRGDLLAGLVNLPFLALGGVALYRIAREVGAPPGAARWAPALYLFTPCVARFAATSYVDPVVNALLFLSVAWLLAFRRTHAWREALLFAASLGLAIGTKYSALLLAAPLVAVALLHLRAAPQPLALLGASLPLPLLGAYWYWRNLWLTGHPFYPSDVEILGWKIFEGAPKVVGDRVFESGRSILASLPDLLASGDLWHALLGTRSPYLPDLGVGPKILPLFILAAVGAARGGRAALVAGILALLWLLAFLVLPYWSPWFLYHNVRFVAPPLALCAALATLPLARAPPGLAVLAVVLSVGPDLLALPLTFAEPARIAIGLGAALAAVAAVFAHRAFWRRWMALPAVPALGALLFFGGHAVHAGREQARPTRYAHAWDVTLLKGWLYAPGWAWLDQELGDRPARIAFTGSDFLYPLYGPRWSRTVRYVDVNRRAGGAHHAYAPGRFREKPDRAAWLENLRRFGADYVVVTRFHNARDWPIEAGWAEATLRKRAEGPMIRVYEGPR
jgi:hypothetical protein